MSPCQCRVAATVQQHQQRLNIVLVAALEIHPEYVFIVHGNILLLVEVFVPHSRRKVSLMTASRSFSISIGDIEMVKNQMQRYRVHSLCKKKFQLTLLMVPVHTAVNSIASSSFADLTSSAMIFSKSCSYFFRFE